VARLLTPVVLLTWLAHQLPAHLGLWLYIPLWAAMAVVAIVALCRRDGMPWYRTARWWCCA
jgi:hypothetical protein